MGGKLKAGIILFVMYGLGIASGMAWEVHCSHHRHSKQMFGERRITRLKKELHLTPWQETTLRDIVQDAHDRANDVHDAVEYDLAKIRADSIDAIQQLLTPEQRDQFAAMRARYRARRHRDQPASDKSQPEFESEGKSS